MQEAEREIAKANPSKQGKRPNKSNFVLHENEVGNSPVSPQSIRNLRFAHNKITDKEFEAAKAEAIETETPLTRKTLIEKGKQNRLSASFVPITVGIIWTRVFP